MAGFALAGALAVPTFRAERTQQRERQARIQAFEAERRQLAAELAEIRRLSEAPLPVVYVGGDDDVDLVIDPETLAEISPGRSELYRELPRRDETDPETPARRPAVIDFRRRETSWTDSRY